MLTRCGSWPSDCQYVSKLSSLSFSTPWSIKKKKDITQNKFEVKLLNQTKKCFTWFARRQWPSCLISNLNPHWIENDVIKWTLFFWGKKSSNLSTKGWRIQIRRFRIVCRRYCFTSWHLKGLLGLLFPELSHEFQTSENPCRFSNYFYFCCFCWNFLQSCGMNILEICQLKLLKNDRKCQRIYEWLGTLTI